MWTVPTRGTQIVEADGSSSSSSSAPTSFCKVMFSVSLSRLSFFLRYSLCGSAFFVLVLARAGKQRIRCCREMKRLKKFLVASMLEGGIVFSSNVHSFSMEEFSKMSLKPWVRHGFFFNLNFVDLGTR